MPQDKHHGEKTPPEKTPRGKTPPDKTFFLCSILSGGVFFQRDVLSGGIFSPWHFILWCFFL